MQTEQTGWHFYDFKDTIWNMFPNAKVHLNHRQSHDHDTILVRLQILMNEHKIQREISPELILYRQKALLGKSNALCNLIVSRQSPPKA